MSLPLVRLSSLRSVRLVFRLGLAVTVPLAQFILLDFNSLQELLLLFGFAVEGLLCSTFGWDLKLVKSMIGSLTRLEGGSNYKLISEQKIFEAV